MKGKQKELLVRIIEKSFIARVAAWKLKSDNSAIVIGNTIHLFNASRLEFLKNKAWLCHELKHIQQFRQYGFVHFILMYLRESLLHGYANNKFEIEARAAEKDEHLIANMKLLDKGQQL
jgi:hypothetical protein